jgi:hypothetical protein
MIPALGVVSLIGLSLYWLPILHDRSEARLWAALLQEARDCTAAREAE